MSEGAPGLTIDGAVATITLRRPGVANRLGAGDLQALLDHLAQVNGDDSIRVLRLGATGRYFCSGYDLGSLADGQPGPFFGDVVDALEAARPLTIAALNGPLFGGATDLALACDFRIGIAATQMSVPAAKIGLHFYPSGLQRYVSRLGLNAAKRLLLTAEAFSSDDMLACGFLTERVADEAALADAVEALGRQLAALAPLSVQSMKRALNEIARGALDSERTAAAIACCDASADFAEGLAALKDKRPPNFTGR